MTLYSEIEAAVSDEDDILEHYGIKGMRWGVRRTDEEIARDINRRLKDGKEVTRTEVRSALSKRGQRQERGWEQDVLSTKKMIQVNNKLADRLNGPEGGIAKINKRFEGKDLGWDGKEYKTKAGKDYISAMEKEYNTVLKEISSTMPRSPVLNRGVVWQSNLASGGGFPRPVLKWEHEMSQSDDDFDIELDLEWDPKSGRVVRFKGFKKTPVIEHYGIKGMKWGVRRTQEQLARVATIRQKVESADAAAAKGYGKTAKKSGVQALSNKELKALNERMELERKYNQLMADKSSKKNSRLKRGNQFANEVNNLGSNANRAIQFAKSPAGKMVAAMLTKIYTSSRGGNSGGRRGPQRVNVDVVDVTRTATSAPSLPPAPRGLPSG